MVETEELVILLFELCGTVHRFKCKQMNCTIDYRPIIKKVNVATTNVCVSIYAHIIRRKGILLICL